jgi:serine/threonine protein phosphatase PrpC
MDCQLNYRGKSNTNMSETKIVISDPHSSNSNQHGVPDRRTNSCCRILKIIGAFCFGQARHEPAPVQNPKSVTKKEETKPLVKVQLYSTSTGIRTARTITLEKAKEKMEKNLEKAIVEHIEEFESILASQNIYHITPNQSPYATVPEALSIYTAHKDPLTKPKLSFVYSEALCQGPRPSMEDAHFYVEKEDFILTGVFDGHGGSEVANFANENFPKLFLKYLDSDRSNVYYAFEAAIYELQQIISSQMLAWEKEHEGSVFSCGSTLAITYVDKINHDVITATLADSEANIYRDFNGIMKSIPLSCVRNWGSERDSLRASTALKSPSIAMNWPNVVDSKILRFPDQRGVNVSRALGHASMQQFGMDHKPKITKYKAQPGDKIIICCDGLKDYLNELKIIDIVKTSTHEECSKNLAEAALKNMIGLKHGDNITIISISVG